jgi:hypothetical protein
MLTEISRCLLNVHLYIVTHTHILGYDIVGCVTVLSHVSFAHATPKTGLIEYSDLLNIGHVGQVQVVGSKEVSIEAGSTFGGEKICHCCLYYYKQHNYSTSITGTLPLHLRHPPSTCLT